MLYMAKMNRAQQNKKLGFTLVELLGTIAVIAVLAVVVTLTLNPAQLLAQGRDAQRVSDMNTLNKAISLYYSDALTNPSTMFMGTSSVVYVSVPDPSATSTAGDQCQGLGLLALPSGYTYQCAASSTYLKINGTGWIPINFNSYSGGLIITKLPKDPINTTSTRLYYTYDTNGTQYEITSVMESAKYQSGGANDIISGDGGTLASVYEKGTQFGLEPLDYGDTSLVRYWTMNEGTGTVAYDYSGNGYAGALINSPTWTTGRVGLYALSFVSSTTQYATTSDASLPSGSSARTIAVWLNTTSTNIGSIFGYGTTSSNAYIFVAPSSASGTNFGISTYGGGASSVYSLIPINDGKWHYCVATYDGTTWKIYIDGVLNNSSTAGTTNTILSGTARIADDAAGNPSWTGEEDDLRIYNRALSAAQISAMYNGGK
jgi:prepilin-type N-terminal cleavage/methylation domain-containing protein